MPKVKNEEFMRKNGLGFLSGGVLAAGEIYGGHETRRHLGGPL